jgi:hypothetical protein
MTFLNFSQLPESVFRPNFSGKHFPENQTTLFRTAGLSSHSQIKVGAGLIN